MKILSLFIISGILAAGLCQPVGAGELRYGVKFGLGMSKFSPAPENHEVWENSETSFKTGFAFGAFLEYQVNEILILQPEILYSMKGSEGTAKPEDGDIVLDTKADLNYIEIPLLAKITVPAMEDLKPVVIIGPSMAFNLSADYEWKAEEGSHTMKVVGDLSDVVGSFDFGLVIGGGFEVPMGPGAITFDARYYMGLTKVITGGKADLTMTMDGVWVTLEDESFEEEDCKNRGFQFLVGYAF